MIILSPVTTEKDKKFLKRFYEEAFPLNERMSLDFYYDKERATAEKYLICSDEEPVGFIILLSAGKLTNIMYFAISSNKRNKGLGSQVLSEIKELKKDKILTIDIEAPIKEADNYLQRQRRVNFYLRNGFNDTDLSYRWQGELYKTYSYNGEITDEDVDNFWSTAFSRPFEAKKTL